MRTRKTTVLIGIVMALNLGGGASTAVGQDESVLDMDRGHYKWIPASAAFGPDRLPDYRLDRGFRRALEVQVEYFDRRHGSADEHGLRDGDIPPGELCMPISTIPTWPPPETWGYVDAGLLLSEVIATARVTKVTLGFSNGIPGALLTLADAERLHERSSIPAYVVVPLPRVVIRDRVFCALKRPEAKEEYTLRVGDRIFVAGSWGESGAVFMETGKAAYLAVLQEDGELSWKFGKRAPESLPELEARIADLEADGLFDLTAELAREPSDWRSRHLFGEAWAAMSRGRCDREVVVGNKWLAALCRPVE